VPGAGPRTAESTAEWPEPRETITEDLLEELVDVELVSEAEVGSGEPAGHASDES
jgi:hypothetical protein